WSVYWIIIHKEFVPPGQTVNAVFYVEVLTRPRKCIARVRPAIVNNWQLHHDNALSHKVFHVVEHLAQHKVAMLPQPPYSPNLALPDFFLFLRIDAQGEASHIGRGASRGRDEGAKQHSGPGQCVDVEGCYFEKF
uniref:Uncharacterized protein n=1 Tax=Cairina moschata TaxID=8855 RepID=A0A8C3GET5_CAIMO